MLVEIADQSQVSSARRAATDMAKDRGFDDAAVGRVALIATELATNLLKHAGRGEIAIDGFADRSGTGLELIAFDKGEGIANIGRALEDGTSTAGTAGTGLGAIRRQADHFHIFSRPSLGTAIIARICDNRETATPCTIEVGAIGVPVKGETVSGDAWALARSTKGPTVLVADGAGHGQLANSAARAAIDVFHERPDEDGVTLLQDIHRALAPTRGAAVALARYDGLDRVVRFVGIGNINGAVISPDGQVRRMVSHNGTAGHVAAKISEFAYPCPAGSLIVLHSDGMSAKWNVPAYPGLASSHPSLVAAILFRDFRRPNDDATVVAMRV
jgi:anti-sigma regulatory factor (Ser/Thr protein kinase)